MKNDPTMPKPVIVEPPSMPMKKGAGLRLGIAVVVIMSIIGISVFTGCSKRPTKEDVSSVSTPKPTPVPTPKPTPVSTPKPTPVPIHKGMVQIPGGWFVMGCSPGDTDCYNYEKPAKRVYVDSFYMDTYEVTQSQYQTVMGNNPSSFNGCPNCPVEQVAWNDAQSYCAKVGKELPTEAQWEYAARGGTTGARYGNLDSIAWYDGNSGSKTHPVGQKQPNAYGLYDMLGNVWEWCRDWYDENWYSKMSERNPINSQNNSGRVIRGGGWIFYPGGVRASSRFRTVPASWNDGIGFRCSRD